MPVMSFCGRWSTSSMRGTTPANSDLAHHPQRLREQTDVTTGASTATVSRPAMTVRDGDSGCSVAPSPIPATSTPSPTRYTGIWRPSSPT
ncbi:hypothetical protein SALBM311S_04680 [Streptomyces alboniger]